MRYVIVMAIGALIPLGLAWLAGFNFDARGPVACVVALLSLVGALAGLGAALDRTDD